MRSVTTNGSFKIDFCKFITANFSEYDCSGFICSSFEVLFETEPLKPQDVSLVNILHLKRMQCKCSIVGCLLMCTQMFVSDLDAYVAHWTFS